MLALRGSDGVSRDLWRLSGVCPRSLGARSCCKNRYLVTLTFAPLQRNGGSRAQTHKNLLVFVDFCLRPRHDRQAASDAADCCRCLLLRQDRGLLLRQDRCLLFRQDRCLLLRQDRCLLLRQDRCLLVRQGAALSHYFTFVLSQQKTSACLNSRHLSCLNSRHLSCLNRRHLSCLNRRRDSCRPPAGCCYVFC